MVQREVLRCFLSSYKGVKFSASGTEVDRVARPFKAIIGRWEMPWLEKVLPTNGMSSLEFVDFGRFSCGR